jgi:hypothetical protein
VLLARKDGRLKRRRSTKASTDEKRSGKRVFEVSTDEERPGKSLTEVSTDETKVLRDVKRHGISSSPMSR